MSQAIFFQRGHELVEMQEAPFYSEAAFQKLLAQCPNLIAGGSMESVAPDRWLIVSEMARAPQKGESRSNQWTLDQLLIDEEGVPTLLAVLKRSDMPFRVEIVGQLLDHAANAAEYWPIDRIKANFEATCRRQQQEAKTVLADHLKGGNEPDVFWEALESNLRWGRIRLVFVADEIPIELRRMIDLLNTQMGRIQVFGIEFKRFEGAGQTTFVSRPVDTLPESAFRDRMAGRAWDEGSFFETLSENEPAEVVATARCLYDWGRANTTGVWLGRSDTIGSFAPTFEHGGRHHQPFVVWTTGLVKIYFSWLAAKPPFDAKDLRRELVGRLNAIRDMGSHETRLEKQWTITLEELRESDALQRIIEVFDWYSAEVRKI